jgi:hypothetical protein
MGMRKISCPCWELNPSCPARSHLYANPTETSQFPFHGYWKTEDQNKLEIMTLVENMTLVSEAEEKLCIYVVCPKRNQTC